MFTAVRRMDYVYSTFIDCGSKALSCPWILERKGLELCWT